MALEIVPSSKLAHEAVVLSQPPISFGALVKQHRLAASLTQEELAGRAGISGRAVSDIERGLRQRVYPDTVGHLAGALGLAGEDRAAFERAARPRPGRSAATSAATTPSDADGAVANEQQPGCPERQRLPTGGFAGSVAVGVLVGRQTEMAHLLTAVDAVARGEGRLALLAGEPGAGRIWAFSCRSTFPARPVTRRRGRTSSSACSAL